MIIRKTQQPSDYPENQIHDAYNESVSDTYSCNYLNNKYLTASVTVETNIPSDSWVSLPLVKFNNQTNVDESKLAIENGKVKIGTGINHIRVSGGVFFQGMGNETYVWAGINLNGDSQVLAIHSGSYYQSCIFPPRILNVSAGDLIEISANTSNASGVKTRGGSNNTWLLVEILD